MARDRRARLAGLVVCAGLLGPGAHAAGTSTAAPGATLGPGRFTTLVKSGTSTDPRRVAQLWRLRFANAGTYDRIVLDERIARSGYTVRYVKRLVADPSGLPVRVAGRYFLLVVLQMTTTRASPGRPSAFANLVTPQLPEVVQVKRTGEFEAVVSLGIGVRAHRGFRVLRLEHPYRIVIDVAH